MKKLCYVVLRKVNAEWREHLIFLESVDALEFIDHNYAAHPRDEFRLVVCEKKKVDEISVGEMYVVLKNRPPFRT